MTDCADKVVFEVCDWQLIKWLSSSCSCQRPRWCCFWCGISTACCNILLALLKIILSCSWTGSSKNTPQFKQIAALSLTPGCNMAAMHQAGKITGVGLTNAVLCQSNYLIYWAIHRSSVIQGPKSLETEVCRNVGSLICMLPPFCSVHSFNNKMKDV